MTEKNRLTEKDRQILDRFTVILPQLSENEKDYILGFGNGIVMANDEHQKEKEAALQTN